MECEVLEEAIKIIGVSLSVIGLECFRQSDLQKVENILKSFNYIPFEIVNWTPTFVFLSRDNPFHMSRLADYLRNKALEGAMKKSILDRSSLCYEYQYLKFKVVEKTSRGMNK